MSKPAPDTTRLRLAHASMQYSDSLDLMRRDARRLFDRATDRDYAWITGTEAGGDDLRSALHPEAEDHGYRFIVKNRNDSWIAVREDLIERGTMRVQYRPLILTGQGFGHHGPRGVLAATWDSRPELGTLSVLACHYLTRGRPDAKDPAYGVNLDLNRQLAREAGRLARELGQGSALVFYGGDQNIVDRDADTFLGEPLTSAWDELGRYENTGHGNIDVIASYDRDGRVKAVDVDAFPDVEFRLASDHFLVEAVYDVRHARG